MSKAKLTVAQPPESALEQVHSGLFNLETQILRLRGLALATRMLASSDDTPRCVGSALDPLADTIVTEIDALNAELGRIEGIARGLVYPPKQEVA